MRRFWLKLGASSQRTTDIGFLVLRVGFGTALAFAHGWGKVTDLGKFTEGVARRGIFLPELLGPAAALSEFIGGLCLALGLVTRPAATFVLLTMLTAAFRIHAADPFGKKEMALAYAVVALAFVIAGPGRLSVDGWLTRRLPRRNSSIPPPASRPG
jgi:putative oxidoreductase